MYICVIVSTVDVNDCIFCANEQQMVYSVFAQVTRSHICIMKQKEEFDENRVQSPKEYFTPPTLPPFLCLLLEHDRRDIK